MTSELTEPNLEAVEDLLSQVSWSFTGSSSRSAFSSTHFYPARFISQLPSALISALSMPGESVLDPFMGSGTTLVETQRLGRRGIGIDINPIAKLVTDGKLQQFAALDVKSCLDKLISALVASRGRNGESQKIPPSVQGDKWYSPETLRDLGAVFVALDETDSPSGAIQRLCFSSVLLDCCLETRHWGYVCDNTRPKQGANPKNTDVLSALMKRADEIVAAYQERDSFLVGSATLPASTYLASASSAADFLEEEQVDLIVTSPPYFGVVDYVKAQRLSMEWFDLDIEAYRRQESGARSKRHRKRASHEFESEIESAFTALHKVLRYGRYCAVVYGTSNRRRISADTFEAIVSNVGFSPVFRSSRDVSVQRSLNPSITSEELIVFKKS